MPLEMNWQTVRISEKNTLLPSNLISRAPFGTWLVKVTQHAA